MKATKYLALLSLFIGIANASQNEVLTEQGQIEGFRKDGMVQFLGIPYAKAPVDSLRWMPPVKPPKHKGVFKATKFGSQCIQEQYLGDFAKAGGSEDCLLLNVYVKEKDDSKKKPVFVWIHGGATQVGAGSDYDPSLLVKDGNTIVVTFNYWLGAFGFVSIDGIDKEKDNNINYGFMDQSLLLSWVQENIEAFGGDKNNVTIAGESSGAHGVYSHIVSPVSKGKFQYAIAMSGANVINKYPNVAGAITKEATRQKGNAFAKALGCDTNDTVCLRSKSSDELLKAQAPYMVNTPIIDENFIPMSYAEAFKTGKINKVTLINGNNLDEGDFFSGTIETMTGKIIKDQDYENIIKDLYGDKAKAVLKEYDLDKYVNAAEAYGAAFTDSVFACPAMRINEVLLSKIPVYSYEFADRTAPSYLGELSLVTRAAHTYEIPYIFKGFNGSTNRDTTLNKLQKPLSKFMISVWSDVKHINTKHKDWKQFDKEKRNTLSIALPNPRMTYKRFNIAHKCEFWNSLGIY